MIVRVTTTFLWMGQQMQNVMHFTNPDGVLTLSQVADDIQANWILALKAQADNDGKWTNINVKNMDDAASAPFNKAVSITPTNDHGDQQVPYMSLKLRIVTGIAGRQGRGRIYIPGLATAHTTNGLLNQSGIDAWNAANCVGLLKDAYLEASTISPLWIGVYHRGNNTITQAIDLQVATIPGVQRRRNIGVGS